MKRRRKRRASPAPLICLLAVLACIVALRISVSEEAAASAQMTGKLENPATTAPVRLLEAEMTEAEQVTWAEDRPARAARYVNIEMTDEELAELAAVVFLEAGNQSAEGQQAVSIMCTDGTARTVNVNNKLNFPAGKLVEVRVDEGGESVKSISPRPVSGTIRADGTALGDTPFADNVQIIDTTSEGVAGAVRPSRLSGVTLSGTDVKYYTTNEKGEIDRLILSDVTGDLWEYAALDGIQAATDYAGSKIDEKINEKVSSSSSTSSSLAGMTATTEDDDQKAKQTALDVRNIMLPSTSDVLYGLVDGSIVSTTWNQLTGSTDRLASYVLKKVGDNVGGVAGNIIDYFASGANYVCYVNGKQVTYTTSVKYPVIAGGVAIGKSADGKKVNAMVQLSPVVVDKLGAGWVMKGDTRYETADDIQVYLWNQGTYYKVSLADLNPQDYKLIGWYDNQGHSAGNKIRLLVAVRTN